ncbi:MAG: sulfatase-like hydrolase/transferase, partial [Solirubrobacteraceae bacterium]
MNAPPNIVYIHSHDTGRYVQPYGRQVVTPNIQRLADQGLLFRNAFSAAPSCSPSRAALLTGRWPHCNGMNGLAHRGFALDDPSQHIVNTLKGAGYWTAMVG